MPAYECAVPRVRPASQRLHPAGIPDVTGRGAAHEHEGPRPVGRNRVLVSTNQGIPIGAWPRVGLLLRHERQHEQKRLLCGRLGDTSAPELVVGALCVRGTSHLLARSFDQSPQVSSKPGALQPKPVEHAETTEAHRSGEWSPSRYEPRRAATDKGAITKAGASGVSRRLSCAGYSRLIRITTRRRAHRHDGSARWRRRQRHGRAGRTPCEPVGQSSEGPSG